MLRRSLTHVNNPEPAYSHNRVEFNSHNPDCVAVQEQFIMAYGGLRGAVGYSLVLSIDKNKAGQQAAFQIRMSSCFLPKKSFFYLYWIVLASALYRKSNLHIIIKEIARPQSQFLHSCVCE